MKYRFAALILTSIITFQCKQKEVKGEFSFKKKETQEQCRLRNMASTSTMQAASDKSKEGEIVAGTTNESSSHNEDEASQTRAVTPKEGQVLEQNGTKLQEEEMTPVVSNRSREPSPETVPLHYRRQGDQGPLCGDDRTRH